MLDETASRSLFSKGLSRLVVPALLAAAACGGSAFSGQDLGGGGNGGDGTSGQDAVGGDHAAAGGPPGDGGSAGAEGGRAAGGNGGEAGRTAGAGGTAAALECSELQGIPHAEHCYVDVTVESVNQLDAATACDALGRRAGRPAALLVLNSLQEQSFIVQSFLSEITDAWLALTCSSMEHPELADCYCRDCEDGLLLEKRAAWTWADGSTASFGWSGNNPDGALRCSALAYNPTIATWGWVDRSCLATSHQIDDLLPHSYRVICELP